MQFSAKAQLHLSRFISPEYACYSVNDLILDVLISSISVLFLPVQSEYWTVCWNMALTCCISNLVLFNLSIYCSFYGKFPAHLPERNWQRKTESCQWKVKRRIVLYCFWEVTNLHCKQALRVALSRHFLRDLK